ncbi:MAG: pyruvate formate-lyase [Oscillospiraceae bacterium]|nr:pyruvate formate-lyase [Oscillospiraceae bacterium]
MIETLRTYILNKTYYPLRWPSGIDFAAEYAARGLAPRARVADRFVRICALETPLIMPGERVVLTRTITDPNAIFIKEEGQDRIDLPCIFTKEELLELKSRHFIHEAGFLSNVIPDFAQILSRGLLDYKKDADAYGAAMIDALIDLTDRYARAARDQGRDDIDRTLAQVPRYPAKSFREALQFLRIINYAAWLEGNYHVTMGRFDLYCWPYLQADLEKGVLTEEEAEDLLCDFFLAFNKDTDLYYSIYRGDNGQSFTLGGVDREGKPVFNTLSRLCLRASKRLKVIDPKINIRVDKNTPLEIYELGSELTAVGLGFPQYTNDDIVIPGFQRLGYSLEDARDYAIAACWEIVVPVLSADIINAGALSFARAVDTAFHRDLEGAQDFEAFYAAVDRAIREQSDEITGKMHDVWYIPSPLYGLFFPFPDISRGAKYNNFGIHGSGVSTAADSLAAIQKYVFDEKSITPAEYIAAVDADFEGCDALLAKLRYETPKMGNDDDYVDAMAVRLLRSFSDALEGKQNCRGGVFRAGTGSAMYYLWHPEEIGASPDGRRRGEGLGTNYSASLFARNQGPFSIVRSFCKPDLARTVNGGPLTLEFHSSMFASEDGVRKLALLVRSFVEQGGHQLQLNTVDAATLKDAQAHPEKYPQLIVRIWGWSAYFVELDKRYQDHVIARNEYKL